MKNILALIGLLVVLFFGLGWYLEWYKLVTERGSDGHQKINVDVDTNKIKNDLKTGTQKVGDIINKDGKAANDKPVQGQPTGMQINPDGTVELTFPKLEIKTDR